MEPVIRAPETDGEWREVFRLLVRSFGFDGSSEDRFVERVHRDRSLAVFVDGAVAAFAQVRPFGQWWGGRSVPLGGYSPVAAAPEHRGRGFGSLITAAHFPVLRERGEVLAGLYPASTELYRRSGFELAGAYVHRRIPTRSLHGLRPHGDVRVRRLGPADREAIEHCYARAGAARNGWIDRPAVWWDRILESWDEQHVYGVDGATPGALDGYVRYVHQRADPPYGYTIEVQEVCTTDPAVLVALWRLVGSSSTQAPSVTLVGPPEVPLLHLLPDQDFETPNEIRWMLRIVDARGAIAARGYSPAVRCAVDLDIADRQCDWNEGRWRLVVEGGEGRLERGGSGDVSLTVNALAALYAGYATAATLQEVGLVRGSDRATLDALSAAFSGPAPWCADFY